MCMCVWPWFLRFGEKEEEEEEGHETCDNETCCIDIWAGACSEQPYSAVKKNLKIKG